MPSQARADIVESPTSPRRPGTIIRRDPGDHKVLTILYTGFCHFDIHAARGEWSQVRYPLVVGHEIVGVVGSIGAGVTRHSVGDVVGVGCFVDSCREWMNCLAGEEQHCLKGLTSKYNSTGSDGLPTAGGYSTSILVDENYVLKIPDGLTPQAAAPLLCAGITMYTPLRQWKTGPGKRVAIVGMGGLVHLGLK